MTATAPPMTPRRVLLLLDGDHALPERGDFFRGAQGGSLAAHSLHHRLKVWASSETGGACQTSVHVFGDVAQFARSLRIPAEILHNFPLLKLILLRVIEKVISATLLSSSMLSS
ncbi:hypothetical protein Rt10032_c03g1452 [Rhodotorula toruloides]|uniref:DUF7923 domain-containing protein n=1 Tax=Rhodotorula toruloides TaxID=5286 RepID=A0A511KBT8_RHOTO|nr:hypothetical protein Rt10032_c03g1452 [Rhodotorula toruloides]